MTVKWGYRLPSTHSSYSKRFLYTHAKNGAGLVSDLSYLQLIQISASCLEDIRSLLLPFLVSYDVYAYLYTFVVY